MSGSEIFAVIFLALVTIGLPLAAWWNLGGEEVVVNKFIKLIDTYNEKRKDV